MALQHKQIISTDPACLHVPLAISSSGMDVDVAGGDVKLPSNLEATTFDTYTVAAAPYTLSSDATHPRFVRAYLVLNTTTDTASVYVDDVLMDSPNPAFHNWASDEINITKLWSVFVPANATDLDGTTVYTYSIDG